MIVFLSVSALAAVGGFWWWVHTLLHKEPPGTILRVDIFDTITLVITKK